MYMDALAIWFHVICIKFYVEGFGVFTRETLRKGDFVAEYFGDLMSANEGDKQCDQTYLFYFTIQGQKCW